MNQFFKILKPFVRPVFYSMAAKEGANRVDVLLEPGDIILACSYIHSAIVLCGSPTKMTRYLSCCDLWPPSPENSQFHAGNWKLIKRMQEDEYIRPATCEELQKALPHLTKKILRNSSLVVFKDGKFVPKTLLQSVLMQNSICQKLK